MKHAIDLAYRLLARSRQRVPHGLPAQGNVFGRLARAGRGLALSAGRGGGEERGWRRVSGLLPAVSGEVVH